MTNGKHSHDKRKAMKPARKTPARKMLAPNKCNPTPENPERPAADLLKPPTPPEPPPSPLPPPRTPPETPPSPEMPEPPGCWSGWAGRREEGGFERASKGGRSCTTNVPPSSNHKRLHASDTRLERWKERTDLLRERAAVFTSLM